MTSNGTTSTLTTSQVRGVWFGYFPTLNPPSWTTGSSAEVYSGLAYELLTASKTLVIGDGSGSTPTGQGSMTVYDVSFDNAPTGSVSAVPVPAAAWLFSSGLIALIGVSRRKKD